MRLEFQVDQGTDPSCSSVHQAGKIVSGNLHIHNENPSMQIHARGLSLYLRGKEYTRVTYRSGKHTRTAHGKHQIMRLNLQIPRALLSTILVDGKVQPGHHIVPFQFQLPTGIPSSVSLKYAGSNSARIIYCLRAVLEGSGMLQDYQGRQEIKVEAASMIETSVPFLQQPMTVPLFKNCCMARGELTFGAKIEDTQLIPGQQIQVKVAMVVDSRKAVHAIQGVVQQKISYKAGAHSKSNTNTLIKRSSPCGHSSQPKMGKDKLEQKLQDTNRKSTNYQSILLQLNDPHSNAATTPTCSLPPIPTAALPTYQGQLIQISHFLLVTVKTDSGVTDPTFAVPLKISRADRSSSAPAGEILASNPTITEASNNDDNLPVAYAQPAYMYESPRAFNPDYTPSSASSLSRPLPPAINPAYTDQLPQMDLRTTTGPGVKPPSLAQLLELMSQSVDDLAIVEYRASRPEWNSVLESVTPSQFGQIMAQVNLDVIEINVALLLAASIGKGSHAFTCQHVVEGLTHISDTNKASFVEHLIPYCQDIRDNHSRIIHELSDWDVVVTQPAFQQALA